jgi:hypothetical protein
MPFVALAKQGWLEIIKKYDFRAGIDERNFT